MSKNKKRVILVTIFSLVIVVITSTFAWLSWRTQSIAMVLTVGETRGLQVTLTPYQINEILSPVSTYTDGVLVDVTANNQGGQADTFKLFYKITTIDNALKDPGFKYTITKCTANCSTASNYTVLTNESGDFSSAASNANYPIYQETVPANTTYKYRVYLWIDSSGGNQSNMQNKSFVAELRANVSLSPYSIMRSEAVIDNAKSTYVTNNGGIQFATISSDTNGKGVYLRAGTQNDPYPIYYYRGAVTDNNVYFGGFCWKMVRTTSTGGTKMIYNGLLQETFESTLLSSSSFGITDDGTYPFDYDSTNLTWTSTNHDHSSSSQIIFAIQTAGSYVVNYSVSSETGYDKVHIYKGSSELKVDSGTNTGMVVFNNLTI